MRVAFTLRTKSSTTELYHQELVRVPGLILHDLSCIQFVLASSFYFQYIQSPKAMSNDKPYDKPYGYAFVMLGKCDRSANVEKRSYRLFVQTALWFRSEVKFKIFL